MCDKIEKTVNVDIDRSKVKKDCITCDKMKVNPFMDGKKEKLIVWCDNSHFNHEIDMPSKENLSFEIENLFKNQDKDCIDFSPSYIKINHNPDNNIDIDKIEKDVRKGISDFIINDEAENHVNFIIQNIKEPMKNSFKTGFKKGYDVGFKNAQDNMQEYVCTPAIGEKLDKIKDVPGIYRKELSADEMNKDKVEIDIDPRTPIMENCKLKNLQQYDEFVVSDFSKEICKVLLLNDETFSALSFATGKIMTFVRNDKEVLKVKINYENIQIDLVRNA